MSGSRIIGVLAMVSSFLSAGAGLLGTLRPSWAITLLAVSAAISAFTERVTGGASKTGAGQ